MSDEAYKQAMRKKEAELRIKLAGLLARLPYLNFDDLREVLTWLEEVAEPIDRSSVAEAFPRANVIAILRGHGFTPNIFPGVRVFSRGRDESARLIIGFALNGLMGQDPTYSMIPPSVVGFIGQWRNNFDTER